MSFSCLPSAYPPSKYEAHKADHRRDFFTRKGQVIGRTVAPFTGAWIETPPGSARSPPPAVAPFTGAWIETRSSPAPIHSGLAVAPFTGAWIETSIMSRIGGGGKSRPSRARGSKRQRTTVDPSGASSRPSRARGSKHQQGVVDQRHSQSRPSRARGSKQSRRYCHETNAAVAPFTGAWIETRRTAIRKSGGCGRALHGRVDRNTSGHAYRLIVKGRALHGRVDRNLHRCLGPDGSLVAPFTGAWIETPHDASPACTPSCRALHGRVDRNCCRASRVSLRQSSRPSRARGSKPSALAMDGAGLVAPFTGAWIETTPHAAAHGRPAAVAPFTGAWIETRTRATRSPRLGRALRGRVDRNH